MYKAMTIVRKNVALSYVANLNVDAHIIAFAISWNMNPIWE